MVEKQKGNSDAYNEERAIIAAADCLVAIFLMVVCAAGSYASCKMASVGGWPTSPGLFPLMVFVSLFLMALYLFISALKQKLKFIARAIKNVDLLALIRMEESKRFLISCALIVLYVEIFFRLISFEISTIVFLILTLKIFWKAKLWKIVIIAILVSAIISILFNLFFKIPLPGGSTLMPLFY